MIKYNDLSNWLKFAVISAWVYGATVISSVILFFLS